MMIWQLTILIALGFTGWLVLRWYGLRTASDVIQDLRESDNPSDTDSKLLSPTTSKRVNGLVFNDDLGRAGLISPAERRSFEFRMRVIPFVFALIVMSLRIIGGGASAASVVFCGVVAFCIGVLWRRWKLSALKSSYLRSIEFHLPLVMERIVMAVQAGLDIIPAVGSVVRSTNSEELEKDRSKMDPVTRLLELVYQLTEKGSSFEKSLRNIADRIECSSLRHAFLHLALAQKEGGELVMPLRELSDSTQNYFQESVEEDIAKMPVRATLPLLCTFAGLVIFFLAQPLTQVSTMLETAMRGH